MPCTSGRLIHQAPSAHWLRRAWWAKPSLKCEPHLFFWSFHDLQDIFFHSRWTQPHSKMCQKPRRSNQLDSREAPRGRMCASVTHPWKVSVGGACFQFMYITCISPFFWLPCWAGVCGRLNYESVSPPPPVLSSMMTEGAATLRARNQLPTLSQPNWATLLTGQVPVQTGVRVCARVCMWGCVRVCEDVCVNIMLLYSRLLNSII